MTTTTGISWTERTWIPFAGCTHISPGCDNCYAARDAAGRLSGHPLYAGLTDDDGRFTGEVRLAPERLTEPLRWRKPQLVFVNSQSDLFHPGLDGDYLVQVLGVMAAASHIVFQVLTKRPKDMKRRLTNAAFLDEVDSARMGHRLALAPDWPRPNWWLGTSIENADYLWRARVLREIPAAVRWLSVEPYLGPIADGLAAGAIDCTCGHTKVSHIRDRPPGRGLGDLGLPCALCRCDRYDGIDWVVVGGESGQRARPMDPGWARAIRDLCTDRGIPFHFKQWGRWVPYEPTPQPPYWLGQDGREVDAHWFPADLTEGVPRYGWWAPPWADGTDDDRGPADPVVFRSLAGVGAPKPATLDGIVHQEYPPCTILDSATP